MSMREFQSNILELLKYRREQKTMITDLRVLQQMYDVNIFKRWYNSTDVKGHRLIHELVSQQLDEVLDYALNASLLDIEARRDNDGLTALQLAEKRGYQEIKDILIKHNASTTAERVDPHEWSLDHDREAELNIVWMDLEMTALEEPEILECAIIITDKNLVMLASHNWVIHYERNQLESLGQWQQDTFKSTLEGGNGLFDDSVASNFTKDQVESELLTMLKRYCPRGKCPLAGSSIQTDKAALKRCMPKVNEYLHYRIIDVTSFQGILKRWTPWIETRIKGSMKQSKQEEVAHRAMNDIEWSIEYMRMFREFLPKQPSRNAEHRKRQVNRAHSIAEIPTQNGPQSFQLSSKLNTTELYADERHLIDRMNQEKQIDVKSLGLNKKEREIYDANPHLREIFINRQTIEKCKIFTFENRLLHIIRSPSDSPIRLDEAKNTTTEHWGQRKLLLTDIEFLTKFAPNGRHLVLYVGPTQNLYISYLCTIFPDLDFVLFDTAQSSIKSTDRIRCHSEPFSKSLAEHYSKVQDKLLFICNIRTAFVVNNIRSNTTVGAPSTSDHDMAQQLSWYHILKPYMSLLSVRLAHDLQSFEFLQGELVIEPWASRRTTECRLIVQKNAPCTKYQTADLLSSLHYFHNFTRLMYYKHDLDAVESEGLDHCYDCRAEIFILEQYLTCVQNIGPNVHLIKMIAKMSSDISQRINDKSRPLFKEDIRTLNVISKH